jgi:tRNA/tmRNA/rRNA uracil-C5-methylase (TrmA/RlmC/RlmD family)
MTDSTADTSSLRTFGQRFAAGLARSGVPAPAPGKGECRNTAKEHCRICFAPLLSYADEVRLKQSAFLEFWHALAPSCVPDPLIVSPQGRHYRMVSRRKIFVDRRTLSLALIDPVHHRPFVPVACAIEPPAHASIYVELQKNINTPWAGPLADELQYVIIRGNEKENTVILNVRTLDPALVRPANTLSKSLTRACPGVAAVFLFEGGEEDGYYLGGTAPIIPRRIRKLFGNAEVSQRIDGKKFLYSPFSFSQVNHGILPVFLRKASELLEPRRDQHLLDLYCGYGLFSLSLAPLYARVTGIELSHASVNSAIANAARLKFTNVRFVRSGIREETAEFLLGNLTAGGAVILDPPRGGTGPGIVEQIAARRPRKVLHIFCNPDILRSEIARWTAGGYRICRAVPLDMFPGTSDLEVMVLLTPSDRSSL